ncbi:MAG: hypothetical protein ACQJCO_01855 [cyanobacterium endosymbiont of Rhopalodia sterrenbergii]
MEKVISSDWQNDYARKKVEYYTVLGIREYSIKNYTQIGGLRYFGRDKQLTLSICVLLYEVYEIQQFRFNQTISFQTFPRMILRY